jgi:hypothetical protein
MLTAIRNYLSAIYFILFTYVFVITQKQKLFLKPYSKSWEIWRYDRAVDNESSFLRYTVVKTGKQLPTLLYPCELLNKYKQIYNIFSLNTTIYLSCKTSYMLRPSSGWLQKQKAVFTVAWVWDLEHYNYVVIQNYKKWIRGLRKKNEEIYEFMFV